MPRGFGTGNSSAGGKASSLASIGTGVAIGKRELLSFVSEVTGVKCERWESLRDGVAIATALQGIWPAMLDKKRIKSKPRTDWDIKSNWELIRECCTSVGLPLNFVDRAGIMQARFKPCYNSLVMLYFMHSLSRQQEFSMEFQHPIDGKLAAFLQSPASIECLARGGSLQLSGDESGGEVDELFNEPLNSRTSFQSQGKGTGASAQANRQKGFEYSEGHGDGQGLGYSPPLSRKVAPLPELQKATNPEAPNSSSLSASPRAQVSSMSFYSQVSAAENMQEDHRPRSSSNGRPGHSRESSYDSMSMSTRTGAGGDGNATGGVEGENGVRWRSGEARQRGEALVKSLRKQVDALQNQLARSSEEVVSLKRQQRAEMQAVKAESQAKQLLLQEEVARLKAAAEETVSSANSSAALARAQTAARLRAKVEEEAEAARDDLDDGAAAEDYVDMAKRAALLEEEVRALQDAVTAEKRKSEGLLKSLESHQSFSGSVSKSSNTFQDDVDSLVQKVGQCDDRRVQELVLKVARVFATGKSTSPALVAVLEDFKSGLEAQFAELDNEKAMVAKNVAQLQTKIATMQPNSGDGSEGSGGGTAASSYDDLRKVERSKREAQRLRSTVRALQGRLEAMVSKYEKRTGDLQRVEHPDMAVGQDKSSWLGLPPALPSITEDEVELLGRSLTLLDSLAENLKAQDPGDPQAKQIEESISLFSKLALECDIHERRHSAVRFATERVLQEGNRRISAMRRERDDALAQMRKQRSSLDSEMMEARRKDAQQLANEQVLLSLKEAECLELQNDLSEANIELQQCKREAADGNVVSTAFPALRQRLLSSIQEVAKLRLREKLWMELIQCQRKAIAVTESMRDESEEREMQALVEQRQEQESKAARLVQQINVIGTKTAEDDGEPEEIQYLESTVKEATDILKKRLARAEENVSELRKQLDEKRAAMEDVVKQCSSHEVQTKEEHQLRKLKEEQLLEMQNDMARLRQTLSDELAMEREKESKFRHKLLREIEQWVRNGGREGGQMEGFNSLDEDDNNMPSNQIELEAIMEEDGAASHSPPVQSRRQQLESSGSGASNYPISKRSLESPPIEERENDERSENAQMERDEDREGEQSVPVDDGTRERVQGNGLLAALEVQSDDDEY